MTSWLPHILLPSLVALAFFRTLPRKWVIGLAPTVFIQDLDYLLPGEHRVVTHTALIPLGIFFALALWWRRRGRLEPFWEFARQPGKPVVLLLLSYYMVSHVVLDVFTGGVVLFWPLSDVNYYASFHLILDTSTNTITPETEAGRTDGPFPLAPQYEWFTYEHAAIVAFLGLVAAPAAAAWMVRRVRRGRDQR